MTRNNLSLTFSIILNGSASYKSSIHVPTTKLNLQLITILYKEGLIRGFFNNFKRITIFLKYNEFLKPLIKNISFFSTGGKKIYLSYKSLSKLPKNSGILLISTTKGIISLNDALYKFKIGGKILCKLI